MSGNRHASLSSRDVADLSRQLPKTAREPESFAKLEKEVNDWLAGKGDSIQPVNSQTTTCAVKMGSDDHQAVLTPLWYLDPPRKI
jgi:hypothetical protein